MADIKKWELKMQEKKKNNTFNDFLKDIVSWYPIVIYKNKGLLSIYPDTDRSCPVVNTKAFEENRESLIESGFHYDFNIDFFQNFDNLHKNTPLPALYNYTGAENSDYAFTVYMARNCYLSFTVIKECENVLYSFTVKENCSNVLNSSQVWNNSQNIYMSFGIINSFNIFYSRYIIDSSNLRFCTNMIGCHNCLMCDGLENKSYCIKNQEYSKEEYTIKSVEILGNKSMYQEFFSELTYNGNNFASTNTSGSFVVRSQDVENGYYSFEIKQAKNTLLLGGSNINENMYDVFDAGSLGNIDFYGVMSAGATSSNIYNSAGISTCSNIYYSRFLENCSNCIGCIGLKNKSFCILNKQYSKEEWIELADKIFEQMDRDNLLGNYFPASLNPFYFNDTIAHLVGNFTKEEVTAQGYLRRDEEIKVDIPAGAEVVKTSELNSYQGFDSDGNWKIDPEILKKVIIDDKGNSYRIIKMEYDFLMKHGLPLPELHWLDRIKLGFRFK